MVEVSAKFARYCWSLMGFHTDGWRLESDDDEEEEAVEEQKKIMIMMKEKEEQDENFVVTDESIRETVVPEP